MTLSSRTHSIVDDLAFTLGRADLDRAGIGLSAVRLRRITGTPWPVIMREVWLDCMDDPQRLEAEVFIREVELRMYELTMATVALAIVAAAGVSSRFNLPMAREWVRLDLAKASSPEIGAS